MQIKILREAGFDEAMLGISLSYNGRGDMKVVADKLVKRGGSHAKFLESIAVWIDITAPRYFWQQFDTYRIGVTKQSESTMHTLTKRPLTGKDFADHVACEMVDLMNELIADNDLESAKANLPESFLQRRIVCTNYMALQRIIRQRRTHKLAEWHVFIRSIFNQCEHPEFLETLELKTENPANDSDLIEQFNRNFDVPKERDDS